MNKNLFIFLVILVFGAAWPQTAEAQFIPIDDKGALVDRAVVILARGADMFLTANKWLAETRKKTDAMIQQTEITRRTARRYEDKALGEMGTLGGKIQTYGTREDLRVEGSGEFGMSGICGASKQSASVCTAGLKLKGRYEKAMAKLVGKAGYADSAVMSRTKDGVEDAVYALLGTTLKLQPPSKQATDEEEIKIPKVDVSLVAPLDLVRVQGERAVTIEEMAGKLDKAIDEATAEAGKGPISSGRARQLDALLTLNDVKAEIELARGKAGELEAYALVTANQLREARQRLYTNLNGARRF